MKAATILVFVFVTLTVYSQNNGMFIDGIPYNENRHFMFSMNSDTIINGTWTQITNYPQALFGVNCYYWPATGNIFTCGGATDSGIVKKSCYSYNPAANNYAAADSLPAPRWSGKLVRVKDSLYLVGSASVFASPDGKLYKYSPAQNHWTERDSMPLPRVHEPAVCVFKDTLIICIGGSTSTFSGNTNLVRIYNPYKNLWKTMAPFPINTTSGHAECNSDDSSIVVVGGVGATFNNVIYYGKINYYDFVADTLGITWTAAALTDTTIFHTGVYRVGGGKAANWMLFGPALRNSSTYNTLYAVHFANSFDTLSMYWYRMISNIPDSAGNRPTLAVNLSGDSASVYLFSGSVGFSAVRTSYKYSFALPVPIGITQISENIPGKYILYQNYPNPFNPVTKIKFSIPASVKSERSNVKLIIYDILGREISSLVNDNLKPGEYEASWNAGDYSSGIYFYKLYAGNYSETKRMILLK